MPHHVGTISAA